MNRPHHLLALALTAAVVVAAPAAHAKGKSKSSSSKVEAKDKKADAKTDAKTETVNRDAPPKAGPVPKFTVKKPVDFKLKNGIKVRFIERHRAPLLDIAVLVEGAGAFSDPSDKPGVADMTSDLLLEGAGDKDALAFSDAIAGLGASLSTQVAMDHNEVTLHVASSRADEALGLLADALTKPAFAPAEVARRVGEKKTELLSNRDDPHVLASLAQHRMLYGTADRRGTPLVGTFASVSGMKADDLRTFWSGHYRPQNMTFVVVGDVSKADLEKKLSKAFGGFAPKGDAAPVPTIKPVTTLALHDKVVLVDVPGAPQSVLQVVGHVPDDVPPFDPAATVMNDLLGVQFTSRLNSNLREEHGYSYGAHSAINHTTHGTVFVASTSVATPVTAPALVEVMKELNRIREAPTDTEAQRSSAFAALTYPSSFESGGSIAGTWAMATVLKADAALLDFPKAAAKVDAKAMGKAGAHVVDPANQGILVVGDRAVVEQGIRDDKLGSLGFLTVDDLLPGTAPAAK